MNERIKELAYEAGQGGHSWYNDPNCIQAFAELIVRECAEYAEHNLDIAGYKKKFMLKHFGVEE